MKREAMEEQQLMRPVRLKTEDDFFSHALENDSLCEETGADSKSIALNNHGVNKRKITEFWVGSYGHRANDMFFFKRVTAETHQYWPSFFKSVEFSRKVSSLFTIFYVEYMVK